MGATEVEEIGVDLILEAHARVGEGPVWDDASGTLVWVDIMGNAAHRYDPIRDQDTAIDVGQPVGAAVLRSNSSGLMLALRDGFGLLDEDSGQVELVAPVEAE